MTTILKAHDRLTRLSALAAIVALVVLTASYVIEVVSRYFLGAPTTWASEVVGYSLCIGIFLMLPEVTRTGRHVAVTVLLTMVREQVAGALRRVIDAIGFATCAVAAWVSLAENLRQYRLNVLTIGSDPIPKWWISSFITFGLAMAALHFLRLLFRRDNRPPIQDLETAV